LRKNGGIKDLGRRSSKSGVMAWQQTLLGETPASAAQSILKFSRARTIHPREPNMIK
jgi:hypothetical protein